MGDWADRADEESEVLNEAKRKQRDLEMEKLNTPSGVTECEECGVDITKRAEAVPSATRCAECQEMEDNKL